MENARYKFIIIIIIIIIIVIIIIFIIIIIIIDGKVRWNTDEYTTAFLYSDWLYFLWHGTKSRIYLKNYFGWPAFLRFIDVTKT